MFTFLFYIPITKKFISITHKVSFEMVYLTVQIFNQIILLWCILIVFKVNN